MISVSSHQRDAEDEEEVVVVVDENMEGSLLLLLLSVWTGDLLPRRGSGVGIAGGSFGALEDTRSVIVVEGSGH